MRNSLPVQSGDIPTAWADITEVARDMRQAPTTPVEVGVRRIVEWYLEYSGRRRSTTIEAPTVLAGAGRVA